MGLCLETASCNHHISTAHTSGIISPNETPTNIYRRNLCKHIRNGPARRIQLQDNWANEQGKVNNYAGIPRGDIPTHRITHESPYGPIIITNRITRVNSNPQTQNYDTHQPTRQPPPNTF